MLQPSLFSQPRNPQAGERYAVEGNLHNVLEVVEVADDRVIWTRSNNNCSGRNYETNLIDWQHGRSEPGHRSVELQRLEA